MEFDYERDLDQLFEDAHKIICDVEEKCGSIYGKNGLVVSNQPFRSIEGDIYTKVLGRYLGHVLNKVPAYEKKLMGRMRADIQFGDDAPQVVIEVKSHGQFGSEDLEKRFRKITTQMPDSLHLYVAFREREDYVEKTERLLQPLKVATFFLSTYRNQRMPSGIRHPQALRNLVETITEVLRS